MAHGCMNEGYDTHHIWQYEWSMAHMTALNHQPPALMLTTTILNHTPHTPLHSVIHLTIPLILGHTSPSLSSSVTPHRSSHPWSHLTVPLILGHTSPSLSSSVTHLTHPLILGQTSPTVQSHLTDPLNHGAHLTGLLTPRPTSPTLSPVTWTHLTDPLIPRPTSPTHSSLDPPH